ncbi:Phosphoinositide phosphatase SAC2, partial [Linum grandiflorum]
MDMETASPLIAASNSAYLQKFRLYETSLHFYMIGRDKSRTLWKVLKIDRSDPSELNIVEDSTSYSESECCELLRRIHEGNKSIGGLKFVTVCYGIVGFIKFLGPYYMLLITQRRKIGAICGHTIYAITRSEMIPVPLRSNMTNSKNENRSFVHPACKWNKYLVLVRRYVRLVLKTPSFFVIRQRISGRHDCFIFPSINRLRPTICLSFNFPIIQAYLVLLL